MKKMLLICMLIAGTMTVNAQIEQQGFVVNGGIGSADAKKEWVVNGGVGCTCTDSIIKWQDTRYIAGISIGYRWRFKMPALKSFHFDADAKVGSSFYSRTKFPQGDPPAEIPNGEENNYWYSDGYYYGYGGFYSNYGYFGNFSNHTISISGTANYSFVKNLSVGLGVEPTFYFQPNKEGIKLISYYDLPVVAKIAYNLKFLEIGIYGKYGFINEFETWTMRSGKIREIQLSAFIPLKNKRNSMKQ
jgi:hypothetical protein